MPAAAEARFSFPILKWEETPDGDLIVEGVVTDDTIDADHQIVNPAWSGPALKKWISTGGNMRVQHSPFLYPAGSGIEVTPDKPSANKHWLRAMVVEDTAKKLVAKGVLRDFSIGVLDPQIRDVGSYRCPGGEIYGGDIGEVSLVDRGSNRSTKFTIAKSALDGTPEWINRLYLPTPADVFGRRVANKKKLKSGKVVDSSGKDRSDVPAQDFAGPGKTFPVEGQGDLSDAASLAHHAKDPEAVRSRLRGIANRKDLDLPPSLDKDDSGSGDDFKTCIRCKAKNDSGSKRCAKCGKKLGMVIKGDAAQDYPGDKSQEDDSEQDYDADSEAGQDEEDAAHGKSDKDGDGDDDGKKSVRPDVTKKGKDVASSAKAKGKKTKPAPETSGDNVAEVPGSGWAEVNKAMSVPGVSMRRMHDATCPAVPRKVAKSAHGLRSIKDAMPLGEFQANVLTAMQSGLPNVADYYMGLVKAIETIIDLPDSVLARSRKAYPELMPDAHPAQGLPAAGDFRRGYISDGRPDLSAAPAGSALPSVQHREVSASDFQRGYLTGGHAASPASLGSQASSSTAVLGQAATAMRRLHQHAAMTWPELCSLNVAQRDYTSGEGQTGISPASFPGLPTSPGEAGVAPGNYRKSARTVTKAEKRLRSKLEKAEAENRRLGALPDPELAPFRGLSPASDGPADHIDKAAPDDGVDREYLAFLETFANSGDPAMRDNARSVIKGLLIK